MDPDENDTLPLGGTENVNPESDTAPEWDYFDPDEDTEAIPEAAATDEGKEEPTEEAEEPEAATQPAQIDLPDGTKVTLDEAVKGYLRQSDYSRKSAELASQRKSLEADLQIVEGITQTFIDHLTKMVPAMPDPAMALRNPSGYVAAKAQHEAAMAQVQQLIELGKQPKDMKGKLDQSDKAAAVAQANAVLGDMFPTFRTPEGRTKFLEGASTAAEAIGFTFAELQEVTDPRMFALAHWANVGMRAEKARETAKAKVASVPPATPRKPGQPAKAAGNADAMRKLTRSGSMRDALRVDWD
jgi:hypothetical protein